MIIVLSRGVVFRPHKWSLDTSGKTCGLGAQFTPTKISLLRLKNYETPGRFPLYTSMSFKEFKEEYLSNLNKLKNSDNYTLDRLITFGKQFKSIELLCFCKLQNTHCHNEILMEWLCSNFPDVFVVDQTSLDLDIFGQ